MTKITRTSLLKYLLPIVLFACVFCVRLSMLQKSSEPNGLDGYFYALQARSFVETGHLENPSHEPGYYLCGICSLFTKNPILGVKVWSALSSAGIALALFVLVYFLTGRFLLSLLALLLPAASPTLSVFGINYINNQTGLFFLILYAASLVKLNEIPPAFNLKNFVVILISVLLFLLSCLCHKVSMMYALLLTFFFFMRKGFSFIREKKSHFQIKNRFLRVSVIVTSTAILITGIFIVICFLALHSPRFLHAFDFPDLPVFHKKFMNEVDLGVIEMSVYAPLLYILSLFMLIKKAAGRSLVFLVPFIYFPLWNLDSDMGLRMWMNAVPLGLPLFLYFFHSLFPLNLDSAGKKKFVTVSSVFFCAFASLLWFTYKVTPTFYNPKKDPPYSYYKKVVSKIQLPADTLLIAHLGLNHVYTYYNGLKDALNWLPDFEIAPEKTWRLSYGVNSSYLESFFEKHALSEEIQNEIPENYADLIEPIDSKYTLLREDLWRFYLSHEEPEIAETYKNWYNPHEVRPSYIRKVKK